MESACNSVPPHVSAREPRRAHVRRQPGDRPRHRQARRRARARRSRCWRRPTSPIPSSRAPSTPRPPRSRRPAARRCRSSATCATTSRSTPRSPQTVKRFGGIDIVVNNASAINLAPIGDLEPKRYDLMQDINVRGTFVADPRRAPAPARVRPRARAHALAAAVGRPEVAARPRALHGLEDGDDDADARPGRRRGRPGIAANCLWPRTLIATAAVQNLLGGDEAMAPRPHAGDLRRRRRRDPRCATRASAPARLHRRRGPRRGRHHRPQRLRGRATGADLQLDLFVDGWPE